MPITLHRSHKPRAPRLPNEQTTKQTRPPEPEPLPKTEELTTRRTSTPETARVARLRHDAETGARYLRTKLSAQLDAGPPAQVGISPNSSFSYRTDENGQAWVDLPSGAGSWDAQHVEWFLRDSGFSSFDEAEAALGLEGVVSEFDAWNYTQWNGPALHDANVAGHDVKYEKTPDGNEWIVLPDGRGRWDSVHAEQAAKDLGHASVGNMFADRGVEGAIDAFNGWQQDHFSPAIPNVDITAGLERGLQPNAARGDALVREIWGLDQIGGKGPSNRPSDHPDGNAIDAMLPPDADGWNGALGQEIADYFVEHAGELGVKYVIFDQQIAGPWNGWQWAPMEDRGSPTENHLDHVHISFHGGELT